MTAIANLVHQQTTTTGTGPYTLTSVNGRQPFDTAFGHGATTNVFYVFMMNQAAAEYMWAKAHMSDATTLVIDTVLGGSNGTSAVSFSAGTIDVTNALPAEYAVPLDGTPVWSGKHEFDAGINIAGTNYQSTFVGSGLNAWFWQNENVTATRAYQPEIGSQICVNSNVGFSNVVTISIASPAVITLNNHPFKAGHPVKFSTTGALPTGLTAGTIYYVISAGLTANTFEVSASSGGAAINTSGSQSGVQSVDTRSYSYKIGLFSSAIGGAASASVYGVNTVTQGYGGTGGYLVTGVESDINNVGADSTAIGTDTSTYAFAAVGAGGHLNTAAYWAMATAGSEWQYGYAVGNGANTVIRQTSNGSGFYDGSLSQNVLYSNTSHSYGVNFFSSSFSGGAGSAFVGPNNVGLGCANAAGSAVVPCIRVDTNNYVHLGDGSHTIAADTSFFTPLTDNVTACGYTGFRWSAVYASNGTIQTSDPHLKTDIQPLPAALPIVGSINPVTFRWKDGGAGQPGKRTHWGFLSPDIKAGIIDKTGRDFGGYVLEEDGTQSIRPDQLIPILWKAVQELSKEIEELKTKGA